MSISSGTVQSNSKGLKGYILEAVNATSVLGHECSLVVRIWCTMNASTHSQESRAHDSKGRSLVSKDTYMLHAARSLSSPLAVKKAREKGRNTRTPWGFAPRVFESSSSLSLRYSVFVSRVSFFLRPVFFIC